MELGTQQENIISDAFLYIPAIAAKTIYRFATNKNNWFYSGNNMPEYDNVDAAYLNFPTIP